MKEDVQTARPKPLQRVISRELVAVRVPKTRCLPHAWYPPRTTQASRVRYHASGHQKQADRRDPGATEPIAIDSAVLPGTLHGQQCATMATHIWSLGNRTMSHITYRRPTWAEFNPSRRW
jgi:hypothetical protein